MTRARATSRSASWSSGTRPTASGSTIRGVRSSVLVGEPETPPWTILSSDGDSTTVLCRHGDDRTVSRARPRNYRDNLAGDLRALGGVAADRSAIRPMSLFAVTADPTEGEGFTEAGDDLVDVRADARRGARGVVELSSPSTMSSRPSSSASAIAPIRKRWRGAARGAKDRDE